MRQPSVPVSGVVVCICLLALVGMGVHGEEGDYVSLSPLPYSFDALEPYMTKDVLETHYTKHHRAYATKLNEAVTALRGKAPCVAAHIPSSPYDFIRNLTAIKSVLATWADAKLLRKLHNNLGGFVNHAFFWDVMQPASTPGIVGEATQTAIVRSFGTWSDFKQQWEAQCTDMFGSGWVWLVYNLQNGQLELTSSKDQDSPFSSQQEPILTIDLWEHAYYLQYKNLRPNFVNAFWNLINWNVVESNYRNAAARRGGVQEEEMACKVGSTC